MNKIPVLDKGFVAMYGFSMSGEQFRLLKEREYRTDSFSDMVTVHVLCKCPLFVKLMFSEFGLKTLTKKQGKLETFAPTAADVKAKDLKISEEIADDIRSTSEALLINPKAYRYDGCDRFVSQVNSPIGLYNTSIITGNLSDWGRFLAGKFPPLVEPYRKAIEEIITAEYREVLESEKE